MPTSCLVFHSGASGLDWQQVIKVLKALLISPLLGFALAGLLILISKRLLKFPSLYEAPKNNQPPPFPIRALMVLTCTGVSFFHGSNDGQKGMGLIMLILIGTVPTAYALNHAVSPMQMQDFIAASEQAGQILDRHVDKSGTLGSDPRAEVTTYIRTKQLQPDTILALSELVVEREPRSCSLQGVQVGSGAGSDQRPQRHVRGQRGAPPDGEESQPGFTARKPPPSTTTRASSTRPPSSFPTG